MLSGVVQRLASGKTGITYFYVSLPSKGAKLCEQLHDPITRRFVRISLLGTHAKINAPLVDPLRYVFGREADHRQNVIDHETVIPIHELHRAKVASLPVTLVKLRACGMIVDG
jgi:hypothetical protein